MQEKAKAQSKRITAHNKMIRQLRANGELKPLLGRMQGLGAAGLMSRASGLA